MHQETLWTQETRGWSPDARAQAIVLNDDADFENLGYEAADPALIAMIWGEPTPLGASESRR